MAKTTHYGMEKPAATDNYDIEVFNENADILDAQLYENEQASAGKAPLSHAERHGKGGEDPVTPETIGAAEEVHAHGAITNDGKIGTVSGRAVMTGEGGSLQAVDAQTARSNLGAAAATKEIAGTLTAAGWTGTTAPFTQVITMEGVVGPGPNESKGKLSLARGTSAAQRAAASKAKIDVSAQGTNTVTVVADGTKPTIDLPVVLHIWG